MAVVNSLAVINPLVVLTVFVVGVAPVGRLQKGHYEIVYDYNKVLHL